MRARMPTPGSLKNCSGIRARGSAGAATGWTWRGARLVYRMQTQAPGIVDLADDPASGRKLDGLDDPVTEPFGRQCLLARRVVERGVRYSLLVHGWENGVYSWDYHKQIREWLPPRAQEVDLPTAGLIQDLKSRGLLDQTLLVFTT